MFGILWLAAVIKLTDSMSDSKDIQMGANQALNQTRNNPGLVLHKAQGPRWLS
jgi:hypothetical protein